MERVRRLVHAPARGFTLVELLVVIGIISVLIAVLLPALSRTRKSANSVKCLASLRQIAHAGLMYTMESKGWLPAASARYPDRVIDWPEHLARYLGHKNVNNYGDFENRGVLWGCPEWGRRIDASSRTGYGQNLFPLNDDDQWSNPIVGGLGDGTGTNGYIRLSKVKHQSQRPFWGDSIDWHLTGSPGDPILAPNWGFASWSSGDPNRHFGNASNHAMLDGSARTLERKVAAMAYRNPRAVP